MDAGQKACEDMQCRMACRAAGREIPDHKDQHPHEKDSDHVIAKL
jgi:hypothetical protein